MIQNPKRRSSYCRIRRGFFLFVSMVLFFAFLPSFAVAKTLADFVGDGRGIGCFPPEDRSPCQPPPPALDKAAQTILEVYRECSRMTQDPSTQRKYVLIAQFLAMGPYGIAIAATYALPEAKDDFLSCALQGWIESGEGTREEKDYWKKAIRRLSQQRGSKTSPKASSNGDLATRRHRSEPLTPSASSLTALERWKMRENSIPFTEAMPRHGQGFPSGCGTICLTPPCWHSVAVSSQP